MTDAGMIVVFTPVFLFLGLEITPNVVRGEPEMKQGRKPSVAERSHISKSISNVQDWLISKKETELWTVIHKSTGQAKQILSP